MCRSPCPRWWQEDRVIGTQLSASSPDEEAFVYAGQRFGYKFVNRSKDLVTIDVTGRGRMQFRVVCMLPYTQMRKMMSLIIEDLQCPANRPRFHLYCKGADSTIMAKLASTRAAGSGDAAYVASQTDTHLRYADRNSSGGDAVVQSYSSTAVQGVCVYVEVPQASVRVSL